MRIMVINPNTCAETTQRLRRDLGQLKALDTQLIVINPQQGPPAIESEQDVALCINPVRELAVQAEQDSCDAIIIACFADPGLYAARESVSIPVLGIEETTLYMASLLSNQVTILTPQRERVAAKLEHVAKLGLEDWLASVRPLEMSVSDLESNRAAAKARLIEVGRAAVDEDGAEVIVLGCATLGSFAKPLAAILGVTVLDPTAITLKMAEGFATLGIRSRRFDSSSFKTTLASSG